MSDVSYEKQDVNMKKVFGYTFVVLFVMVVFVVIVHEFYLNQMDQAVAEQVSDTPPVDYESLVADETEVLASYKVIDPDKGVYRIPVERAMELIAAESFSKRK